MPMNAEATGEDGHQGAALSCEYCGRANAERLAACSGCGTPLITTPTVLISSAPRQKSKFLAVCLALVFGPLGLFYATASGAVIMILIAAPFIVSRTGGYWVSIGGRLVCAVWAVYALTHDQGKSNSKADPQRLLDKAMRLESVDRTKAINAYKEVIRLFHNTSASREAARNVEVLTRLQSDVMRVRARD